MLLLAHYLFFLLLHPLLAIFRQFSHFPLFTLSSKHLFIPNFLPELSVAYTPLTEEVKKNVQFCYDIRQEGELPVLSVYVPKESVEAPKATHLDIILYSREQINMEDAAMDKDVSVFSLLPPSHSLLFLSPHQPYSF